MKELNIWCDGACIPNPGVGGYAAIILEHDVPMFAVMGYEEECTNNRMEMMAVIASLEEIEPEEGMTINLHSDSQYVINPMTKGWGKGTNTDLWKRIDCQNNKFDINWVKVAGHSGNRYNEECDALSTYCVCHKQPRMKIEYSRIVSTWIAEEHSRTKTWCGNGIPDWLKILISSKCHAALTHVLWISGLYKMIRELYASHI